jgi:hypothetical protein
VTAVCLSCQGPPSIIIPLGASTRGEIGRCYTFSRRCNIARNISRCWRHLSRYVCRAKEDLEASGARIDYDPRPLMARLGLLQEPWSRTHAKTGLMQARKDTSYFEQSSPACNYHFGPSTYHTCGVLCLIDALGGERHGLGMCRDRDKEP